MADDPAAMDTSGLRQWILGFCIIRFDLEQGQTVEECYPPDSFTPEQQLLIAFSSFPDSMSHHNLRHRRSSLLDSIFSFRFPATRHNNPSSSFVYGYVFNRQRHDDRLPRGGDQRSVVILSHSPFSSVFRPLLQILAPLCFDLGGRPAVDLVAAHVSRWPPPLPGSPMDLPLAASSPTLRVRLPDPDLPFSLDSRLFSSFRGLLLHLWHLWELLLLGAPLLLIAPTPTLCSDAVVALVGIISPLTLHVDFRPYFTIHDPDFLRLNSLPPSHPFPPLVLGVTNLFFLKALPSIPHIVSVGSAAAPPPPPHPSATKLSGLFDMVKLRREGPLSLMTQHKEAVWSAYSAVTKPDTAVLNRLVDAGASGRVDESMLVVNNEILRRHFLELTTNFLAPFGPYMRATTPSEGASPYGDPPQLLAFRKEEFLAGLAARGAGKFLAKRMRSNWLDLYRRFLEGHNFMPWFQKKRAAAEQEQQRLWRRARMRADIHKLISKMSELERVDLFNAIEHHLLAELKLQQSGGGSEDSTAVCQKFKGDLQVVFNVLPKDTQQLLLLNSERAALIQGKSSPHEAPVKLPGHPVVSGSKITTTTVRWQCI
ncbi:protein DENND6B isoform X1 [Iris pallida]|uniref:Protein DENND6B isoform X1 n=1 Tax=Iris pallida TaxID=29817 RepID=A0AAX6HW39_IRIPA|nr:protein DENND6B isoform X1 [Iris pallida]